MSLARVLPFRLKISPLYIDMKLFITEYINKRTLPECAEVYRVVTLNLSCTKVQYGFRLLTGKQACLFVGRLLLDFDKNFKV